MDIKKQLIIHKYFNAPFRKIFKIELGDFLSFYGFDLELFEKFINPPEGVSLQEEIKNKYGEEGVKLIEMLLKVC